MAFGDKITIDVCLHAESAEAYLISPDGESKHAKWIGESICELNGSGKGRVRELELPERIAFANGWI